MRILIATATYYPMINGVATFAHNLAVGLTKKGHEVAVVCPSFTGKKHVERKDGVIMYYLSSMRLPLYPDQISEQPVHKSIFGRNKKALFYRKGFWVSPVPSPEIKKILKTFQPDVIHSQTCDPIGIAIGHYAREFDTPLVTTGHTYPDQITAQLAALKMVKKPLDMALTSYLVNYQRHSDYATMPTEMAIEDLIRKRRREFQVPVEALSNGVDLTAFNPGRANIEIYKKYKLPTDRPIALHVGRVDPEKSISTVIEAFAQALEKVPEALLVIVGDGTDRGHLEELVQYYEIENNVKFLGRVMPPALNELYKVGDVFVTASEIETQGIVLIEAAATGLPLVAVDKGAVAEVCKNEENGFLCQPGGDVDGIAEGLVKILSDRSLQRKMSDKSLEIAKKHDIIHTLSRFEEIYKEAVEIKKAEVEWNSK